MHKLERIYVERRIAAPLESVLAATADLGWEREPHYFGSSDRAPLRANVRIGAFLAEVEVTAWSDTMTHIGVRPRHARPHAWTGRRRGRWFDAAHGLIDDIRGRVLRDEPHLRDYASVMTTDSITAS